VSGGPLPAAFELPLTTHDKDLLAGTVAEGTSKQMQYQSLLHYCVAVLNASHATGSAVVSFYGRNLR
jgi:hypothetical protein